MPDFRTILRHSLVAGCVAVAGAASAADRNYSVTELVGVVRASDINNRGEVSGWAGLGDAIVWRGGAITPLGSLGGLSNAYALNDSGDVVGQSILADGSNYHAFLYTRAVMSDIGMLASGGNSVAWSINRYGDVVGYFTAVGGAPSAPFIYLGGLMNVLPATLGGAGVDPRSINDLGQVVGTATTASGLAHAFFYSDGATTDLGTFGGPESHAYAINKFGWAVGTASLPGNGSTHAFLWKDGQISDLGTLGGLHSFGKDINSGGEIVGHSWLPDGSYRGFVYSSGPMRDLTDLVVPKNAWTIRDAIAINDKGQIVAEGCLGTVRCAALLLTPLKATRPGKPPR